jgi:nucleoside 2-deoxyribosyltransferase
MKVYFACSIRGGRDDAHIYAELASHLKTKVTLLTEIFADGKLTSQGMNKPSADIWATDLAWVQEADIVIAEVTNPSLGVGYEIAKAEEWNKPILALFRNTDDRKLSAMIAGSSYTDTIYYDTVDQAKLAIDEFLQELQAR